MVCYRRNRVTGGTFFFTVTVRDRRAGILVEYIDSLRQAVRTALSKRPFSIDAMVVLPDHLHAVWTLPADDSDYPARWRMIKASFSRSLAMASVPTKQNRRGEYDFWQRRYWEHTIRDEADLRAHIDYIHFNPVRHGLVDRVRDWPYSTFHRFVRDDMYPIDWAGDGAVDDARCYGE